MSKHIVAITACAAGDCTYVHGCGISGAGREETWGFCTCRNTGVHWSGKRSE